MNKSIVVGLVVSLLLGTGLAAAGILTVSLEPSLDSNGTIKAASITKAEWFVPDGQFMVGGITYKMATITNGTAEFNLSARDAGESFILINGLYDDPVPTHIDDTTKDVHQFVGKTLRVSVIGNPSDPTYLIKTFSKGQGKHPVIRCFINESGITSFESIYIKLSLKTIPQKFETIGIDVASGAPAGITSYTPTALLHPSTLTSFNPPFSEWVFKHGEDYGGNDSKCNTCHGNLEKRPEDFYTATVSNGFCFKCHFGKGGTDAGFSGSGCVQLGPLVTTPTPVATAAKPTPTLKTPAFEALLAITALLMAVLVKRR
ncbi:MAG: hypothetical protein WCE94_05480 [Candidatus Methanoperedens sp.]